MNGIDVSQWQSTIAWPSVKASGIEFAIVKTSEGSTSVDPYFTANWKGAHAAGLTVGGYHYAHPENGQPELEARHFLATLPTLVPGDFVALDIETPADTMNRSAWALAWLRAVEAALGFQPLVYSYLDWLTRNLTDPALSAYPLWLADYAPACPPRAGVWPVVTMWQNTDHLSVPGIQGNVDGDQIARDAAGLRALGKPTPKPKVPTYPRPAVVAVPGSLKTTPSHSSIAAIDPRKQPVWLEVGADLSITGPVVTTDDHWLPVSLVRPESVVHGYLPQGHVAEPAP